MHHPRKFNGNAKSGKLSSTLLINLHFVGVRGGVEFSFVSQQLSTHRCPTLTIRFDEFRMSPSINFVHHSNTTVHTSPSIVERVTRLGSVAEIEGG